MPYKATQKREQGRGAAGFLVLALAFSLILHPAFARAQQQGEGEPLPNPIRALDPYHLDNHNPYFSLEDGASLREDHYGFNISGGYPYSRFYYQFCPDDFFDLGFGLHAYYDLRFTLLFFLEIQLLESPGHSANLSLKVQPEFLADFQKRSNVWFGSMVSLESGFRVYRSLKLLLQLAVTGRARMNEGAGSKYGLILTQLGGLEVTLGEKWSVFALAGVDWPEVHHAKARVRPHALAGFNFGF